MYPFRIRITDKECIVAFEKIKRNRVTRVEPNVAKKIGHKVPRKIKRDGFFIEKGRIGIDNPLIDIDYKPAYGKRKGIDVIFNNIL